MGALVLGTVAIAPSALAGKPKHPATTVTTITTPAAAAVTSTSPVRMVAATASVTDLTLHTWQPDSPYAHGGSLTSTTAAIVRTGSDALYQHARVGVTGYDVPVASAGTYFVDLFTSETSGAGPGQRVWGVTAEGAAVATDVDAARDAGPATASHVLFAVPVTDGTLNIRINPGVGTPIVDAVEVDYEKAATATSALFSDDFTGAAGTSPDSSRWGLATGGNGWGNNELESYTNRPSNAGLDGAGNLDIVGKKETYTGGDGITRNYTSARLTTVNTFSFQYGTAVARMRIPGGQGLWPAFWGLGTNQKTVGWPLCGEMDIMENHGDQLSTVHATVHAALQGATTQQWNSSTQTTTASPLSSDFHTYGMVWGPNAMAMTLDGQTYFSLSSADLSPTSLWNFNHPFFLLLNLAIGGNTPGAPDSTTPFPAVMAVDYVHVTG
ncbi:MAG TPA: family 16 glycosylhydrolase [Mycobacteriales bacterium]|nr:family 16 glycosylhydrolase [Mycobacteriales bacterium]